MYMKIIKNFNRMIFILFDFIFYSCVFCFLLLLRAYKNLNDLKKEFHEKIESLTNKSSDSTSINDNLSSNNARTGTSANQQQTVGRRPMPDDPLIDPLAAGRRPHPYAGGW